ncbi:hypothetical protein BKI52_37840 [marine bacterium AO1-C]|nr:hypothetical protein BKI52_37840 [marine bacterium AO1-C]
MTNICGLHKIKLTMTFTKKLYHLIIFSALFSLASCGYGKYNASSAVADKKVNYEDSRVYGDGKEQPARQTKQTYPTPENAGDRMNKIKDKLYGKPKAAEAADSNSTTDSTATPKADSTKIDTAKAN